MGGWFNAVSATGVIFIMLHVNNNTGHVINPGNPAGLPVHVTLTRLIGANIVAASITKTISLYDYLKYTLKNRMHPLNLALFCYFS